MKALIATALLLIGSALGPNTGQIRGHVRYPACMPPEDLQVCAERNDGWHRCVDATELTEAGVAYTLDVPAGNYLVYSTSETYFPGYRAYYSKAVRCGLTIECHDHDPIQVRVRAGQIVKNIDPDDWFAPREIPFDEPSV